MYNLYNFSSSYFLNFVKYIESLIFRAQNFCAVIYSYLSKSTYLQISNYNSLKKTVYISKPHLGTINMYLIIIHAGLLEQDRDGDQGKTYLRDCKGAKSVSIVIRGGTEHIVDNLERAIDDALRVVKCAVEDGRIVAGGGASEIEVALGLRAYAASIGGREQMAIRAFADALEEIPRTIARNAGLDTINTVVNLRAKHTENKNAGLNINTGAAEDMLEKGIVDPLRVKINSVKAGSEAAVMVLRVDDMLRAQSTDMQEVKPEHMASTYDGMSEIGGPEGPEGPEKFNVTDNNEVAEKSNIGKELDAYYDQNMGNKETKPNTETNPTAVETKINETGEDSKGNSGINNPEIQLNDEPIPLNSALIGRADKLVQAKDWIKPLEGWYDVIIHAVNVYINKQRSYFKWGEDNKGDVTSDSVSDPSNSVEQLSVDPKMMSNDGKKLSIVVATTKSFAVEAIVNKDLKCCNMILKNDPMPDGTISVSQIFGTGRKNQEAVEIVVYESDFTDEFFDIDEDYAIGTVILELPSNLPNGAPIEITLSLNNEGILEVTGKDVTSNKEVHVGGKFS